MASQRQIASDPPPVMSRLNHVDPNRPKLDPVYRHARREGIEILAAWAAAILWTIIYCSIYGYQSDGEPVVLIAGIPSWVCWGVGAPWLASSTFTVVYALFRMRNDPLGDELPPSETLPDETEQ